MVRTKSKKKANIIFKDHYFNEWLADTVGMSQAQRGIYSMLQAFYFDSAGEEGTNGRIATDSLDMLGYLLDCRTEQDMADLVLVLRAKFKITNKYYRHANWDKEIKNIRQKMRNDTSKSNGKDDDGNGAGNAHCDKSNTDGNANIYTHDVSYAMTNAERQEKHRKLQRLINKGVQADKSMTLDEVRTLFDMHFGDSNASGNTTNHTESNDNGNKHNDTSNAQNRANNYKSVVTNQESKNKESVASVTSQSDAHTLTQDFSNVSKSMSINDWQGVELDMVNSLLSKEGFSPTLDQVTLDKHLSKFKKYYANREMQGSFLLTEALRLDKLISWIIRERPVFASNATNVSQEISQNAVFDPQNCIVIDGRYQPCFDDMSKQQTLDTIKKYRLPQESTAEAYHRISQAGVQNCTIHKVASPDFVKKLASNFGAA